MGTPPPSLRSSPELITSSILCTPREPSSIGTSVRVWRKVSSPRQERILLPLRRITRRLVLRPPRERVRKKVWSDHNLLTSNSFQKFHILHNSTTINKPKFFFHLNSSSD